MRAVLLFLSVGALVFASAAKSQECPSYRKDGPSVESVTRTLSGELVFHNEYRQWFGLKLDAPVCGVQEVQLVDPDRPEESPDVQHLEVYRGCRVKTTGVLDVPGTTYFSTKVFQVVNKVDPSADCHLKPRFPDYSARHPSKSVRSYRVLMQLDYTGKSPVKVSVLNHGNRLAPPEVYAPYFINGSFSIAASCNDAFKMSRVRGTPQGGPTQIAETAWIDPESVAAKGSRKIWLSYQCIR